MSAAIGWAVVILSVWFGPRLGRALGRRARANEARWRSADLEALGRCCQRAATYTHNPTTGQVAPASWGDVVRDDLAEYLAH